ncbi:MAG: DUF2726 domain-containing protein [Acidobacteria bacterium]|nr:DUF2726 domain-containing protein [Acidobacteriota bacterium]
MDAVDIILRVCLWASVALIPILLLWALFGAKLSGSLKRSRPKAKPVRRQGFTPAQPRSGSRRPVISRSTTGGTGASPRPAASKPPGGPKPRPASGRGFILPPPRHDKPAREAPASVAAAEAPPSPPKAAEPPDELKPEPMGGRGLIPQPPTHAKPDPKQPEGATADEGPSPRPDPSNRLGDPTAQMEFISKVDFEARPLLSKPEYTILRILEAVAQETPGGLRVMAQTSLGEVLAPQPASASQEARDLAFRSINSKRLDFLMIDAYGMPVLAVEYQGHGHFSDTTFMRDAVKREALRKAGIRLLEVPAEYDAEALERDVRRALPSNPTRRP